MFSYILDFTGYILLISICPMLKVGKLHNIAASAIHLQSYLNIALKVQNYGGFLLNWLFYIGSLNSRLCEQILK